MTVDMHPAALGEDRRCPICGQGVVVVADGVAVHARTGMRAEVTPPAWHQMQAVLALLRLARKVSPSPSMMVYVGDVEHALGLRDQPVTGKVGQSDG